MKHKRKEKIISLDDYLQIQKDTLNEISQDNVVYEEVLLGPQEEAMLQEIYLNLDSLQHRNKGEK